MEEHRSEEELGRVTVRERLYGWAREKAKHRHAPFWLALISFSESSFFLVPPDVVLIAMLLSGVTRWVYLAGITTAASVLGGLFGYLIGFAFFETVGQSLVELYGLREEVLLIGERFNEHAFVSIFISAFTPIPYKVFTMSAGLFRIDLAAFVVASLLGRGLRFFALSYLTKEFGPRVVKRAEHYLLLLAVLGLVVIAALLL